jgi:uncharacterized protein (DUF1778 family)
MTASPAAAVQKRGVETVASISVPVTEGETRPRIVRPQSAFAPAFVRNQNESPRTRPRKCPIPPRNARGSSRLAAIRERLSLAERSVCRWTDRTRIAWTAYRGAADQVTRARCRVFHQANSDPAERPPETLWRFEVHRVRLLSAHSPYNGWMAPRRSHAPRNARLETRLTAEQKVLFERAATASGRSVTDFVLSSATEEARRVLLKDQILELSAADSLAFADAILNPPPPSARLRLAAARYFEAHVEH